MKASIEIIKLWKVIGEIGTIAEKTGDKKLSVLYQKLSSALDYAEESKLIEYENDINEEENL